MKGQAVLIAEILSRLLYFVLGRSHTRNPKSETRMTNQ